MDDNEANRRGFVGSGSLFFPMGIHTSDDQHIFVADKDNHRVLLWNKIPFSDGWNADVSIGQRGTYFSFLFRDITRLNGT